VDDHPLFREGLQQLIDRDPELGVCGEAATNCEALESHSQTQTRPGPGGYFVGWRERIELIKAIKNDFEELPVLVVSMHDESLLCGAGHARGAMGYVMKHEPSKTLEPAIHKVLAR